MQTLREAPKGGKGREPRELRVNIAIFFGRTLFWPNRFLIFPSQNRALPVLRKAEEG